MNNRVKRLVTVAMLAATVAATGAANAGKHGKGMQAAIDFRTANMTIYKWYMGPMGMMVKGKRDWDAALFQKSAEGLAQATRIDLLPGFPEGSLDEDSEALPEIWEKWSEFTEKFEDLQREAAKLAEVAKGGDMAAMKAQFKETGGACGGCHKPFREKKE